MGGASGQHSHVGLVCSALDCPMWALSSEKSAMVSDWDQKSFFKQ